MGPDHLSAMFRHQKPCHCHHPRPHTPCSSFPPPSSADEVLIVPLALTFSGPPASAAFGTLSPPIMRLPNAMPAPAPIPPAAAARAPDLPPGTVGELPPISISMI